jgi:hypothetical protein
MFSRRARSAGTDYAFVRGERRDDLDAERQRVGLANTVAAVQSPAAHLATDPKEPARTSPSGKDTDAFGSGTMAAADDQRRFDKGR